MKYNRAYRRAQVARLRDVRRHYNWFSGEDTPDPRRLGMIVGTPHLCSKVCCGNQRHIWGKTLLKRPEIAQCLTLKEELRDLD